MHMTKSKEVEIITVIAVHSGDNDISNGTPTFFYSSRFKAGEKAKNNGWYGVDAPISEHKGVVFPNGDVYLLANGGKPIDLDGVRSSKREALRQQALAKLTEEERAALLAGSN
jgi:hypothetical protein